MRLIVVYECGQINLTLLLIPKRPLGMEFISTADLGKYKAILDQIDNEYKKNELLKKELEKNTNRLTAVRLTTEKHLSKDTFKVLLKVYDSVFDLFFLYGDDQEQLELEALLKFPDCKFYVVEVNVSQGLALKLSNQKFVLHACVRAGHLSVCRSVSIYKKQVRGSHLIIVPVDGSVVNATVSAALYINNDDVWSSLHFSTITVDISYHFTTRRCLFENDPAIRIAKHYQHTFADQTRPVEYKFKCKCDTRHFIESVIKNCYHRFAPEALEALTDENASASVDFYVRGENKATLKLDKTQNVLTIACDVYDLCPVKKYFIGQIRQEKVSIDKTWLHSFLVLEGYLGAELCERPLRAEELSAIYKEMQKLMGELDI